MADKLQLTNYDSDESLYLHENGGAELTCDLTLPNDPTDDMHAATKQYVDNAASSGAMGFPDYSSGTSKSVDTVYQAANSGYLYFESHDAHELYIGETDTPSTMVACYSRGASTSGSFGIMIPIPAGYYYKMTITTSGTTSLIWYDCV